MSPLGYPAVSTIDGQATADPVFAGSAVTVSRVMSVGRWSSLPLWNTAPARTTWAWPFC